MQLTDPQRLKHHAFIGGETSKGARIVKPSDAPVD